MHDYYGSGQLLGVLNNCTLHLSLIKQKIYVDQDSFVYDENK